MATVLDGDAVGVGEGVGDGVPVGVGATVGGSVGAGLGVGVSVAGLGVCAGAGDGDGEAVASGVGAVGATVSTGVGGGPAACTGGVGVISRVPLTAVPAMGGLTHPPRMAASPTREDSALPGRPRTQCGRIQCVDIGALLRPSSPAIERLVPPQLTSIR